MSEFLKGHVDVPNYMETAPRPEEPENDIGFADAFSSAYSTISTLRGVGGVMSDMDFEEDPEWTLDLDKELSSFKPHEYAPLRKALSGARSQEHADWLKRRTMDELAAYEDVAKYTNGSMAGSMAIMLGASIADPLNLAATVATGGVGVALTAAQTAKRFGRIKAAGKVAGMEAVVNAALEVPLVAGNPTAGPNDILWAAMFGGAIGAGIGGLAYKVKPGTKAKKMADQHAPVADKTLGDMAKVEAHEAANEPLKVDVPDDLAAMSRNDPVTRSEPAPAAPKYNPAESIQGRKAELEAKLEAANARQLPDEPVAPKAPEMLEGMREELDFIKKVRAGDVTLSQVERTKADIQFNKAKGEFMESFRDEDPDGFQKIFGNRDRLNPPTEEFEARLKDVEARLGKVSKRHADELEKYSKALDTLGEEKDLLLDQLDELEAELAAARQDTTARSVGAAETERGGIQMSRIDEEQLDDIYDIPEIRHQRVKGVSTRIDNAGQVDRSPNQMMRDAGQKVFQDAQTKAGHAVNPESASELAEWVRDIAMGTYDAVARNVYPEWLKEQGFKHGLTARALDFDGKMRAMFEEEVTEAVKSGWHESEHVLKAAHAQADAYKKAFDYAVDSKLPGFEDLTYDPTYVSRRQNHESVMEFNSDYVVAPGQLSEGINHPQAELWYRAIMEKTPTFDPATTARIANNIAKRAMDRATKVDHDMPDFGMMTRERLEDFFDTIDVTDVDRKNFFASLDQQFAQPDAGRVSHAKKRMDIETLHTPLRTTYTGPSIPGGRQTGDTVDVTLDQLMEKRGDILLQGYVNDIAGWGSLNRVTGGKVHNQSSLKKWMEDIVKYDVDFVGDSTRHTQSKGFSGKTQMQLELDRLMIGINHTLGRAIAENDASAWMRRVLGGWNFTRVMNQVIFPQISESSKIITSTSLETTMHYMPTAKRTLDAMRRGEPLDDEAMKLVLAAREIGLGTNVARGGVVTRYQTDLDGSMFTKQDKWAHRLHRAKSITARPLQVGMDAQEVLAFSSLQAELGMRFKGIKQFDEGDYKRLAWMGLDRDMVNRIKKQMMRHATDEQGRPYASSDSKWVGNANLDKWDDPIARDKYGFGMKRRIGEIIQTNNPGNLPKWAFSNIGQTIAQFRTFPLAAWNKQLLHHLSYGDMNVATTFMMNSMFATMAYAGQRYLSSIGREDRQEYLDRALSQKNLMLSAWERSAWGSFTPMVGDVLAWGATNQAMNPYSTRSTGLGQGVKGVPVIDLAEKVFKAGDSLMASLHGDGSPRKAFMDAYSIMPFYNMLGLYNAVHWASQAVPE